MSPAPRPASHRRQTWGPNPHPASHRPQVPSALSGHSGKKWTDSRSHHTSALEQTPLQALPPAWEVGAKIRTNSDGPGPGRPLLGFRVWTRSRGSQPTTGAPPPQHSQVGPGVSSPRSSPLSCPRTGQVWPHHPHGGRWGQGPVPPNTMAPSQLRGCLWLRWWAIRAQHVSNAAPRLPARPQMRTCRRGRRRRCAQHP